MRMISALVDKYEHCSLSDLGYILKFRNQIQSKMLVLIPVLL